MSSKETLLLPELFLRKKRFVYNANSTCGGLAYCSSELHDPDLVLNTSLLYDGRCSKTGFALSILVNVSIAITVMFGNAMIIYIMTTNRKFRTPQGVFKTSLAVFDFLVGAIIIPSTIHNEIFIMIVPLHKSYLSYLDHFAGSMISDIFGCLFSVCICGSLFSLLLLTIDRLMAVHWPLQYSTGKFFTLRRARLSTGIVWLLSIVLGLLGMGDPERYQYDLDYMTLTFMLEIKLNPFRNPGDLSHGLFFLILVFIFPYVCVVIVTLVTWFLFWWSRHKHRRRIEQTRREFRHHMLSVSSEMETSSVHVQHQFALPDIGSGGFSPVRDHIDDSIHIQISSKPISTLTAEDKDMDHLTKVIVVMVLAFSVCVVPFLAVQADSIIPYSGELKHIYKYGVRYDNRCSPVLYMVVMKLLFMNSLCNFLIYNVRNALFRDEVKILLRMMLRQCRKYDAG